MQWFFGLCKTFLFVPEAGTKVRILTSPKQVQVGVYFDDYVSPPPDDEYTYMLMTPVVSCSPTHSTPQVRGSLSITQEEDEADEDDDAFGQVLSLLALLVQKYKY